MKILDGRRIAEHIREELKGRIARLKIKPGLAIVQIGDNPESSLYVKLKERAAQDLGMHFEKQLLPENAAEALVLTTITALNKRMDIHGIVIQLPLPAGLETSKILSAVALEKDVDGLHPTFQRAVQHGVRTHWLPALQQSILKLLDDANVPYRGKSALILAKSSEFRTTLGALLRKRGCRIAEATTKESALQNLGSADIVVTALGAPRTIRERELKPGAILIDAGLTKLGDGSVAGDFFGAEEPSRLSAFSPVPGGIGPVTVATLLRNTVIAAEHATRRSLFTIRVAPTTLLWFIPALTFSAASFFFGGQDLWGRLLLFGTIPLLSLLVWGMGIHRIRGAWWKQPDLFLGVFLALATLSTILSPIPRKSLEELSVLVLAGLAFFLGRSLSQSDRQRFASLVVLGAVALSLWSLWGLATSHGAYPRIPGPFKNPDGLGAAILLPLLFSLGLMRTAVRRWQQIAFGIAGLILAGTLAATAAVSSLIGLAVATIVAVFVFRESRKRLLVGLLLLLLLGGGLATIGRSVTHTNKNTSVVTGFSRGGGIGSLTQRISFVRSSLAMLADHPVFGVGLGTWSDFFPRYERSLVERTELAHGVLPQYTGELGSIGLLSFSALLVVLFFALLRSARQADGDRFLPYALTGLFALAIAGCIDIPWFYPVLLVSFWFCAGMFLAPLAVKMTAKRTALASRIGITLIALALLGYGLLRMVTSYYATAAGVSTGRTGGYLDALATSDLAMRLLPTPSEELQMTIILFTKSLVPGYREQLNQWAERTIAHNTYQPASYLLYGRIKMSRGDTAGAEMLFQQGLERDPHFVPDLAVDLGNIYLSNKQYADARDLAIAQIARTGLNVPGRDGSLSSLSFIAAKADLALNDRDAAKKSLEQALMFSSGNTDAQALLEQNFKAP